MKKRVYISVYDKENIVELAKELVEKQNYEIVSTGGTFCLLKENNIEVIDVSQVTSFPEMLSGKLKSLHPNIFAGILADVKNSKEASEIAKFGIKGFDMVVVNLYPFEEIARQTDNVAELVKNIDIGGVALLRAGAKNYKNVAVVTEKSDYKKILEKNNEGFRQSLALKAFSLTSDYDEIISTKLEDIFNIGNPKILGVKKLYFEKLKELRYGENPHQKSGLYKSRIMVDYEVLWGKELSHNNILDITTAVNIVSEFYDVPSTAIVKHTTPCGVALGKNILESYQKAFDCDPISAFGGIVAFSRRITPAVAKLLNSVFLEVIIAPEYDEEAFEILKTKKNLRIVKLNTSLEDYKKIVNEEINITPFGVLIQDSDKKELDENSFKVVTKTKPTAEQIEDAIFAWKVAKHAKSNAIVIAKDFKTLAIGQGQTSRICSMEWALNFACDGAKDAVLASDGFFPAVDNIQAAAQCRIGLIIQPGGSIKDKEVISAANKYKISMITTKIRHFRH